MAPLPSEEGAELPLMLFAITYAYICEPQARDIGL